MNNDGTFVISDDEISNSFQELNSKHKYLTDFCRENSIPLWTGNLNKLSASFNIARFSKLLPIENAFKPMNDEDSKDEWGLFISRLKHSKPDFVFLQAINSSYDLFSTVGYYIFEDLFKSDEEHHTCKFIKSVYERIGSKHIGIEIFLFYSNSKICIKHEIRTRITFLLVEYKKTEEDIKREAEENEAKKEAQAQLEYEKELQEEAEAEEEDQRDYDREFKEAHEAVEKYAKELSVEKKLALTRNFDQRYAVAKTFFGERFSEIKVSIDAVTKRAMDIFEIDVLPALVKELKDAGKTAKNVSDELGISIAKAKKIYAVV